MKKIYLFLSVFLVVAASCTNSEIIEENETNEPLPIDFTTFMYKQKAPTSKAMFTNLSRLQASGFKVMAAYTAADDMSASANLNFMVNEDITYSAPHWGYTDHKYWPADPLHRISFFGYALMGGTETISTTVGYPELTYTVPTSVKNQKDIVVASLTNQIRPPVNTAVYLNFHHALSSVVFSVKTDFTAGDVIINDLIIDASQIRDTGTFTFANDFHSGSWAIDNTSFHTVNNDTIIYNENFAVNTSNHTLLLLPTQDNYWMLIPQTIANNDVPLTIKFSLQYPGGALMTGYTATASLPAITFEKDRLYTYNLTLKVNDVLSNDYAITFGNPTVVNWTDETVTHDVP